MFATVTYPVTAGPNAVYSVPFGSLDPTHIKVTHTVGGVKTALAYGTDYTVNAARTQVTVLPDLKESTAVKVYRETPRNLASFSTSFQDGTVLKSRDLNKATTHLLYLVQETTDREEEWRNSGVIGQLQDQITGLEKGYIKIGDFVQRTPTLWAPYRRSSLESYKPKRLRSRRTAGAAGDAGGSDPWYPATLVDNHGATDHLYPYMVPTGVDFYGLPHNKHKRLRSSNAGNDSGELGYEFGHDIAAGDLRSKATLRWELTGAVENVGWEDAFIEFAVEVNPTVGDYAGPNLIRLVSPPLGATWGDERPFVGSISMEITGPDSWTVKGEFTIYSDTGEVLVTWPCIGTITGADHDWLRDDARVQLRWRVDRNQDTRLDTFDGFNQGARQGTDLLRLHIDTYEFTVNGVNETR